MTNFCLTKTFSESKFKSDASTGLEKKIIIASADKNLAAFFIHAPPRITNNGKQAQANFPLPRPNQSPGTPRSSTP